ncbi:endonuclease-reverse transcriptase [Elysia marginata]|uniref:Endonuclease-reverse transcriptase n=1 Tax=Elysia marginata TaxID=1093978 RepID=A0AAV4I8G2_9GAST|nr:endonuclease-reverse transcriptase [Elysia marginata]
MKRVRNALKPEIDDTQCGFLERKGTVNAIYTLRMIVERALEVIKTFFLCLIYHIKAFDKVQHGKIIDNLEKPDIDGKDLKAMKNLYWEQTAAIRVDNDRVIFN